MNTHIFVLIAPLVFLSGCANDNYSVIANGRGSQQQMAGDLKACKISVVNEYESGHSHLAPLLGAIGGAVAPDDDNAMKLSDMNPAIEKCMREHGYVGTSEN
jgi:hypothetical protein